jgi:hypothetical protein
MSTAEEMLAQAIERMNNMQQQMQSMQLAQQAQAQQLAQQAKSTSSTSSVNPSAPQLPRLALVQPFDGQMGTALDHWEREMKQQFDWYSSRLGNSDNQQWVGFAAGNLKGAALQYYYTINPASAPIATFAELLSKLRARYRPVNASTLARQQLKSLKQSAKQSVSEHTNRFQAVLCSIENMHQDDQVDIYLHSLLPALARRVFEKQPKSLAEAVNHAVTAEGLLSFHSSSLPSAYSNQQGAVAMDMSNMEAETTEAGEHQTASAAQPSLHSQLAAVQAQLSAMQSSSSWRPSSNSGGPRRDRDYPRTSGSHQKKKQMLDNVTPAQARERMNKGACIKCGQMGHYKDACKSTN